jgi:hypothetical protein
MDFVFNFIAGDLKQHPIIFMMVVVLLYNQRVIRKEISKFSDWCLKHMEFHADKKE